MSEGVPHIGSPHMESEQDPFQLFATWFKEASTSEPNDPDAMALATVDADGLPNVRMVLLKGLDGPKCANRGFVFYTNLESAKGAELSAQPKAALGFHWKSLQKQVRVRGLITRVSDTEADEYFSSRARGSQIGAWASAQSRALESRMALEKSVVKYTAKFGVRAVPRPAHWSGFRLIPLEIEFWQAGTFRLHDRLQFRRKDANNDWESVRLYP